MSRLLEESQSASGWGDDHTREVMNRAGVTIEHASTCPVAGKYVVECNCGLWAKYLVNPGPDVPNHADDCPCHCTCDFGQRLATFLTAPPRRSWWGRVTAWLTAIF